MMQRKKTFLAVASGALLLGLVTTVVADDKLVGTYTLDRWGYGTDFTVKVWVQKDGDSIKITRQAKYADGTESLHHSGKVWKTSSGWWRVDFVKRGNLSDNLNDPGNTSQEVVARAVYGIGQSGKIRGLFLGKDAAGKTLRVFERGKKGADEPVPSDDSGDDNGGDDNGGDDNGGDDNDTDTGDVKVVSPRKGAFLAGQELKVELKPADAELVISGPAEKSDDGIKLTGAGEVTLKAKKGETESQAVKLTSVMPEVAEVTVLDAIALSDGKPPHFKKGAGDAEATMVPAAIFQNKKLKLKVKLQGSDDLSSSAKVDLEAKGGAVMIAKSVSLKSLKQGNTVTIESREVLNEGVSINALELTVKVGGLELAQKVKLRVYTSHKAPVKNIDRDQNPPNTIRHFEKACGWANGAAQNIGNGDDSIGYQVDNRMRHYVHLGEEGITNLKLDVPDYKEGAAAPTNYKDLRGWVNRQTGERGITSLYYPPLEPTKEYQKYHNYRNNFGWWVLDNPKFTGGRCNQQASLVCGILGTLGIKGRILYLHRYGKGKKTGRPVRQYFYSNDYWPAPSETGGGPWNFHGVALMTMADGSEWIYDGSFSSPPNRKNGTREWAENAGGPFIHSWGPWLYDDWQGGRVPDNDIPEAKDWQGVQKKAD